MQSHELTPRFRNLSNHLSIASDFTPRHTASSLFFNEKDQEEHRDPEKECFMCRQSNVYMKPIGMQHERRVARRHPPPLTRAEIEELCQKKKLTKREARKLLQCFFPEIKNVKYFQLHKYHSCCYDPKHLNLCKNHITALQHERDLHGHHQPHEHPIDDTPYKDFERDAGSHNRVSFVRIKIEPTKGIPTRFLGPAALPESLANMLIKQVNRLENKKKPASFETAPVDPAQTSKFKALDQPYDNGVSRLSEYLSRIDSNDDDDDDDDEEEEEEGENYEHGSHLNSRSSRIRGFEGKVMDGSRLKYEREVQVRAEKNKSRLSRVQGDLVVEDLDELNRLFTDDHDAKRPHRPTELAKRKRARRMGNKKRSRAHRRPKLNHWEQMALDQSKQEVCGCRHHVKRLEADQVVYDWCRCKDHQHRDLKVKQKPAALPPPPPPPETPKPLRAEKKSIGLDAMPPSTTDVAISYDATDVDYDVIQEVLYYRTSSGRLIKPEISSSFPMSTPRTTKFSHIKNLTTRRADPFFTTIPEHPELFEESGMRLKSKTSPSPMPSSLTLLRSDTTHFGEKSDGTGGDMPMYKLSSSMGNMALGENGHQQTDADKNEEVEEEEEEDEEEDEEEEDDGIPDFTPPKYLPEEKPKTPVVAPPTPLSMRRSSKPSYMNSRPTPNFERESSILANRRWFDQPLGDQNLLPVQDGRYGLIAGTSNEKFQFNNRLPDNDYTEPYTSKSKSSCTIS